MKSLLCAVGVGASAALPMAATLNWVIKDGLGQLGGVIFARLHAPLTEQQAACASLTRVLHTSLHTCGSIITQCGVESVRRGP